MKSVAEIEPRSSDAAACSAQTSSKGVLVVFATLVVVCLTALFDWLTVPSTRLYLDESSNPAFQRGSVWQHFAISGTSVVPEIISRDGAHFAFQIPAGLPRKLYFAAQPDAQSAYEIYFVNDNSRQLIAKESLGNLVKRELSVPFGAGELQFVVQGNVAWFDLRWARSFFLWPVYAVVAALLLYLLIRRGGITELQADWTTLAVGSFICVAAVESILHLFPLRLPPNVLAARHDFGLVEPDPRWTESPRYKQRLRPNLKIQCEWELGDIARMGFLTPHSNPVKHRYPLVTDAEGFRNPTVRKKIDVAALGDSFTDAMTLPVEQVWPARLEQISGKAVQNYGTASFGPQQELLALQDYAIRHQPRTVVVGFFGGNDLSDAEAFDHWHDAADAPGEEPSGWRLTRKFRRYETAYLWTFGRVATQSFSPRDKHQPGQALAEAPSDRPQFQDGKFRIPMKGNILEFAFMPPYLQKLASSRSELSQSRGWQLTRTAFRQMKLICEQDNARLVLMFIPSKSAVYWPIMERALPADDLRLAVDFSCRYNHASLYPQQIHANRLAQNNLLRDFCAEEHIPFLDLTPTLQEKAESGVNVYFADDSHWNAEGHEVAARRLAEFLAQP